MYYMTRDDVYCTGVFQFWCTHIYPRIVLDIENRRRIKIFRDALNPYMDRRVRCLTTK